MQQPTLVLALLLTTAGLLPGQEWFRRISAPTPVARQQHAVAYDAARGQAVLFGGSQLFAGPFPETWTWNGSTWTMAATGGPQPRIEHAMAYDPNRQVVVLFGGQRGSTTLADTWEWNGANWGPRITPTIPSARRQHGMAYDPTTGKIVMFAGWPAGGGPLPETWLYDGINWVPQAPAVIPPIGTSAPTMTTRNGRAVANFSAGQLGMVTWEWDGSAGPTGNRWHDITVPYTALSFGETISAAPGGRLVLVVSKSIFGGAPMEVYEHAPAAWVLRGTLTAPPSDRGVIVAFDSIRGVTVMFSGNPGLADTWEFDNDARLATVQATGTGCGQPGLSIAAAPNNRPLVGGSFRTNIAAVPPGGALMSLGFSKSVLGPFGLPFDLGFYGMPGCSVYHDLALMLFPTVASTGATTARHDFAIANARALIGVNLYLQAWGQDPGANSGGIVTSNLLELGIGNY